MIYIAADHNGFAVKQSLMSYLRSKNYTYEDLGAYEIDTQDDFTKYAFSVGEKVAKEVDSIGILVCRSGVGMTIAANKVKGVRACLIESEEVAKRARNEDYANVIVFDSLSFDSNKDFFILETFINTPPDETERYIRRRNQIIEYENKN